MEDTERKNELVVEFDGYSPQGEPSGVFSVTSVSSATLPVIKALRNSKAGAETTFFDARIACYRGSAKAT